MSQPSWLKFLQSLCRRTATSLDDLQYQRLCRELPKDEKSITLLFDGILDILARPSAQSRYLAVCLVERLLTDNDLFRELFFSRDMAPFFEKTVGLNRKSLPCRPSSTALRLKQKSLAMLSSWQSLFASNYPQIHVFHNYIFEHLKLDSLKEARYFTIPNVEQNALKRLHREKILIEAAVKRIDRMESRITDALAHIAARLAEADELIQKTVPINPAFAHSTQKDVDTFILDDGLVSLNYKLEIFVNKPSPEVASYFWGKNLSERERIRSGELFKQFNDQFLPHLNDWISKVELSVYPDTDSRCRKLLDLLLPIRMSVKTSLDKFQSLGLDKEQIPSSFGYLHADNEIFEEVVLKQPYDQDGC